jgi:hypothetical protein
LIDVLRINRDAVGVLETESLPIRQAASSRAQAHAAANSIRKQVVVVGDGSTQRSQANSIVGRRARGVAAPVVQDVVLVRARPSGDVAD